MKLVQVFLFLTCSLLHASCDTTSSNTPLPNSYVRKLLYEITHDLPGFVHSTTFPSPGSPAFNNQGAYNLRYDVNDPVANFDFGRPGNIGYTRTDGIGYGGDLGDGKHLKGTFGGFHTETVETGKSDDYGPSFGNVSPQSYTYSPPETYKSARGSYRPQASVGKNWNFGYSNPRSGNPNYRNAPFPQTYYRIE